MRRTCCRRGAGSDACVGRTLLSAAFDFDFVGSSSNFSGKIGKGTTSVVPQRIETKVQSTMKFVKPPKPFMEYAEPILVESLDAKAIRLLNEQLKELESVRGLSSYDPLFKAWHNTTVSLLKRFLAPTSPHLQSFIDIGFWTSIYPAPPGHEHQLFVDGCRTAEASLKAVVKEIENFGVHVEQNPVKTAAGRGGPHQTFHGPVTIQNQAIATDNAIQKIGNMGDTIGASLKEIAEVFKQSEELSKR